MVTRCALHLVEGLSVGGTVWKGTDGAATSYHCGKSIMGQELLSDELGITIDAQVEAPGHGKCFCRQEYDYNDDNKEDDISEEEESKDNESESNAESDSE